ncbi:MAG: hypothetical protein QOD57_4976, partial [Actinomycetota bacterium]|nr:hypothetical protein [Actinomycetota bacterium]
DFVGAGRTLRRLDLLTAADALVPGRATGNGPSVAPAATLADAMAALLTSDGPSVRVIGGGSVLGEVTLDSIRAALRQSQARQSQVDPEVDVEVET